MSEYIGSRISLISKSDIRYIGTLHEINSENSTVALENVSSYGTEGRKGNTGQDVPPSDQLFEYIVFRGSDVKELSIVEAPKENKPPAMPNDPAILGSARPPHAQIQQQQPPHSQFPNQMQQPPFHQPYDFPGGPPPPQFQGARFQGPGGPHGFPGQPGAIPGFNPAFGGPPPPNFYGPPPGAGFGQQQQQHPQNVFAHQQTPIGPPDQGRPSPVANADAIQASRLAASQKPAEMSGTPVPPANTNQPPAQEKKPINSTAKNAAAQVTNAPSDRSQPPKKAANTRVALPLAGARAENKAAPTKPATKPTSYADATSAATAAVAAAMAQLAPSKEAQPGSDNLAQKVGQMRLTHDANVRGRGHRARSGAGVPRGGRREAKPVEVPKEDYDFASANAKFNKQDLGKETAASGSPSTTPAANGADGNVFENGHGADAGDDVVIPPKPTAEKGYDKKTSFFDNISSDLKDRSEAQTVDGRAMRNQERSKNMETFGQGSIDGGHRGGFRGRGRGRGRNNYPARGGFDGARGSSHRGRARGGGDSTVAV